MLALFHVLLYLNFYINNFNNHNNKSVKQTSGILTYDVAIAHAKRWTLFYKYASQHYKIHYISTCSNKVNLTVYVVSPGLSTQHTCIESGDDVSITRGRTQRLAHFRVSKPSSQTIPFEQRTVPLRIFFIYFCKFLLS